MRFMEIPFLIIPYFLHTFFYGIFGVRRMVQNTVVAPDNLQVD